MATDIEPVAYLIEWYDAGERRRLQFDKTMEPWLHANEPSYDGLYRSEVVDELRRELAGSRERNLLANERADNAVADLEKAWAELATFRSERSYVIGCNTGWDEAIEQAGELAADYDCRLAEYSGPVERTYYEAGVVDATVGIAAAIRKLGGKTE